MTDGCQSDGRMDGQTDDQLMDGLTNGWMDGLWMMDGWTNIPMDDG